jgi:Lar family restriction alleviation protein
MSELKPCPFCGGEVAILTRFSNGSYKGCVVCMHCQVEMHPFNLEKKGLIERWNRRAESG